MSGEVANRITVQCLGADMAPLLHREIVGDSIGVTAPPGTVAISVEVGWRPGRLAAAWLYLNEEVAP